MNNYVSTEKSLKRWLKTRVKVTMATVVGFLIAGTVAFGATVTGVGAEGTATNDVTEITDKFFLDNNLGAHINTGSNGEKRFSAINIAKGNDKNEITAKGTLQSKNEKSWLMTVTDGITLTIEKDAVLSGKKS